MSEIFCCPECGLSLTDPNPHYAEWAVQMHRMEEHGRAGDLRIEIHRGDRAVGLITRRLEKASNAT